MSIMRCHCDRYVDLDWHCEDWDEETDQCRWCAEKDLPEGDDHETNGDL